MDNKPVQATASKVVESNAILGAPRLTSTFALKKALIITK